MELVKDLGTRTVISKAGKRDTRSWGLFKCPSCDNNIELKTYKGLGNNTCGKAGCRKRSTAYGSWNKEFNPEDKLKALPHNSAFTDFYYRVVGSRKVCSDWVTVKGFREDMYASYCEARAIFPRVTLFISDSESLGVHNCKWVNTEYVTPTDFSLDVKQGERHTYMLAQEVDVKLDIVIRALSKMDSSFGETAYKELSVVGFYNRPYKANFLSEYQYNRLRDKLLASKKKASSHVYLVTCDKFTKIGMSGDVGTRLGQLRGSSALPIELKFSCKVPNASTIEKYLHKKYASQNSHHEWFNLTDEQIEEVINYLKAHVV